MAEIDTCPHCGGEGTIIVRKGKDGWRDRFAVLCDYEHGGCGAESGWYHSEIEAVEAWNKRVPPTEEQLVAYINTTRIENMEMLEKLKKKHGFK